MSKHHVIIGNGVAGITCARHLRKKDSDCRITVISAESKYFYSRTALMYIYMGHMKQKDTQPYEPWFWTKNRIELIQDRVKSIDTDNNSLALENSAAITYDNLVLATGSKPNYFGWKGQDLKGVGGLYSLQDLANMETYTSGIKKGVIIGGGLIGIEMAEMLLSRGIEVEFLVRESKFWGNVLPEKESELIMRHMKNHHVNLLTNTELDEIIGDENGRVKAIKTNTGEIIECGWVGLTAGVSPNVDFIRDSNIEVNRGIKVNEFCTTNVDNVFAIGDCAEFNVAVPGRRNIEQVWYTGKIMGETLSSTLTGTPTPYNPGIWFNSAKFFDIEYQTYGWVMPNLRENENDFYWENDQGDKCMHFVFDKNSEAILGVNTFGIRLRHQQFHNWIKNGTEISEVIGHLKDANFDPEFFKTFEEEVVQKFNKDLNKKVAAKKKSWTRIFGK